jgi:uncharacterized protein YjbJ (UPF0337 family)
MKVESHGLLELNGPAGAAAPKNWTALAAGTAHASTAARQQGGTTMSHTTDDLKGRAKEAAGDLTDDKSLKNERKTDRAAGKVKDVTDDAADKVKDVVRKD